MWTVCWVNANDLDRWERFETSGAVRELLDHIGKEINLEDIMIFPPETDGLWTDGESFKEVYYK